MRSTPPRRQHATLAWHGPHRRRVLAEVCREWWGTLPRSAAPDAVRYVVRRVARVAGVRVAPHWQALVADFDPLCAARVLRCQLVAPTKIYRTRSAAQRACQQHARRGV